MPRKRLADPLTFEVIYEPDEGGWCVRIPAVPGCQSEGRSLREARRNIREALSTCVDVFPNAVAVARSAVFEEDVRLPPAEQSAVRRAYTSRSDLAERAATAQEALEDAARILTTTGGLSLRDAAELLDLSHERVKQLAAKKRA